MAKIHIIEKPAVYPDSQIAIVASRYNSDIVDRLLEGCLATLKKNGISEEAITVIKVPGAYEIPVVTKRLAVKGEVDAIITLGAIIRGDTPHFEYIANECAGGLSRIAIDHELPVIFGVLTVENQQQALERSEAGDNNKGSEAASSALEMISVLKKIG